MKRSSPGFIRTTVLAAAMTAAGATAAKSQTKFDFTIPNMMRGPELFGRAPSNVRWTPAGDWIYFLWNTPGTPWDDPPKPFRISANGTGAPEALTAAQYDDAQALLADGPLSPDGLQRLVSANGDLFVYSLKAGTPRRLTQTAAAELAPRWSADGSAIYYQRDGNAWSLALASGLITQLSDIRPGPAPRADARATGERGALVQDQLELLQVIRDQARRDSITKAERDQRDANTPLKPAYLALNERVTSIDIAPTGKYAFITADRPPANARATSVPSYVTSDGFTAAIPGRTKVGDEQNNRRAGLLDFSTGKVTWLRTTPADTARPSSLMFGIGWNASGTRAAVYSVTYDFKTRYIHTVDTSGKLMLVDELRDSAWVGGPCSTCAGWVDDATLWYVSEASGYSHIYTARADGSAKAAVTSGKWEVTDVRVSPDHKAFWFHSSEESPFVVNFYRVPIAGGARERLTSTHGGHEVTMAPDGVHFADVFSTAKRPPELFIGQIGSAAETQRTQSATADWLAGPWITPEIIKIKATDGVDVPARIYEPKSFGAKPNGAAVIFVHGAGYLHNVYDYWSSYPREYMFNQFLASKGYTVLDLDYRGSAGYGRDWRTAIYRWMGGRDLQDNVDASKWLTATRHISPDRIGVYGGSYGGFITLMALFTAGDYFGAGAALRPVTDWAHYNNGYTGQILNLPQDDTVAYHRSSPIFFAQGLKDPLLIAHGMVDTNVHYEDSIRLIQRLIELGKTGWELASYPVENHGFVRPSSWTDEYTRIFNLFERSLNPGGKR